MIVLITYVPGIATVVINVNVHFQIKYADLQHMPNGVTVVGGDFSVPYTEGL